MLDLLENKKTYEKEFSGLSDLGAKKIMYEDIIVAVRFSNGNKFPKNCVNYTGKFEKEEGDKRYIVEINNLEGVEELIRQNGACRDLPDQMDIEIPYRSILIHVDYDNGIGKLNLEILEPIEKSIPKKDVDEYFNALGYELKKRGWRENE